VIFVPDISYLLRSFVIPFELFRSVQKCTKLIIAHRFDSEGAHQRRLQINCCHSTNRTEASSAKSLATYKYFAKKQQGRRSTGAAVIYLFAVLLLRKDFTTDLIAFS
jgi:hypothetical protein